MNVEQLITETWEFLFFIAPFAAVFFLGFLLFNFWVQYARRKFLSNQDYSLLRIYPPREIYKTPAAMELFLNALYQTGGEANPVDIYWSGKSRPWFSLELASINGEVGFFIWTRSSLVSMIENQIYSQFPGIEIEEVEDYVSQIDYDSGNYSMFGLEYKLTAEDPVPIKTYVDYGLDKSSEDPGKYSIDPLSVTLEFLGSLKEGENAWIQIMVKAHKKEDKKPGTFFQKTDAWVDESKELIKKIREDSVFKTEGQEVGVPMQTKGQIEKISAIERSVSKLGFDCGIRAIYIADKDSFNGINIPALIGSFKQFGSADLNGFKPAFTTSFDYKWQDWSGKKVEALKRQIFEDYKSRVYFGTKIAQKYRKKFILNTEELATIFHFPSSAVATPSLNRIQSKKSEAPSNLPIQ